MGCQLQIGRNAWPIAGISCAKNEGIRFHPPLNNFTWLGMHCYMALHVKKFLLPHLLQVGTQRLQATVDP